MSVGFPDWQRAVGLIDRPALLGVELNRLVPFSGGALDVRPYQSYQLSLQYEAANAGPPQNTARLSLEWGDDDLFSNKLYRQDFEINSINTTDCGRTLITDRMHGPFMHWLLTAGLGAADNITLVAYGTTRPVDKMRCLEYLGTAFGDTGQSSDRILAWGSFTLAAGATGNVPVRIGSGLVYVLLRNAIAGPFDIHLRSPAEGTTRFVYTFQGLAAGGEVRDLIAYPARALYLTATNNHATATGTLRYAIIEEGA